MLELTEEQHRAVESGPEPPRLIDPLTNKAYVLVSAPTYERLRRALEEVDPSFYEFDEIESR
jgi:hypothetical protein